MLRRSDISSIHSSSLFLKPTKWMCNSLPAPALRTLVTTAAQLRSFLSFARILLPTLNSAMVVAISASTAARERVGISWEQRQRAVVGSWAPSCDFVFSLQIRQSRTGWWRSAEEAVEGERTVVSPHSLK